MQKSEIIPALLQVCPSVASSWEEHIVWWGDDERGDYNDIAVFAHHIVESYSTGEYAEFPAFFGVLERMLTEGSPSVRKLATIGLIEDIQNIASHEPGGYRVFEKYLGCASRAAWAEVEEMWRGRKSLADVLRSEIGVRKKRRWWQFWRRSARGESTSQELPPVENPELRRLIQGMYRAGNTSGMENEDA